MAKTVLIVDDSEIVRSEVRQGLSKLGYNVVEAADGQAGLDTVSREQDIALVICDVNMPRMDGITMLEEMRKAGHQHTVIMMTTEGTPKLIVRARKAGAKGWLVKPVAPRELEQVVAKLAA